jgi:hypothetical protein
MEHQRKLLAAIRPFVKHGKSVSVDDKILIASRFPHMKRVFGLK